MPSVQARNCRTIARNPNWRWVIEDEIANSQNMRSFANRLDENGMTRQEIWAQIDARSHATSITVRQSSARGPRWHQMRPIYPIEVTKGASISSNSIYESTLTKNLLWHTREGHYSLQRRYLRRSLHWYAHCKVQSQHRSQLKSVLIWIQYIQEYSREPLFSVRL